MLCNLITNCNRKILKCVTLCLLNLPGFGVPTTTGRQHQLLIVCQHQDYLIRRRSIARRIANSTQVTGKGLGKSKVYARWLLAEYPKYVLIDISSIGRLVDHRPIDIVDKLSFDQMSFKLFTCGSRCGNAFCGTIMCQCCPCNSTDTP